MKEAFASGENGKQFNLNLHDFQQHPDDMFIPNDACLSAAGPRDKTLRRVESA